MSLIIAEKISKVFASREVLKDISFRLGQSDRIGLVGPNGEGKTTLLRIIAGLLEPSAGQVHTSRGLCVGYLPQDPPALEDKTIHQAALEVFADLRSMETTLHSLASEMAGGDPAVIKRYGALQTRFEGLGGYTYVSRIAQVLTGLAFPCDMWERPLSQLSGGQRTRVYLATLLLKSPDVLLLDEPTNHLDLQSVEWLESWLAPFRGAMIVVSHDRYFLDHVTRSTWEISSGSFETYRAPYSGYVQQRAERHKERLRVWHEQQEYIAKTQEFIRIHLAGQRSKEAKGRRTRLERFMRDEAVDRPKGEDRINLTLRAGRRAGDLVLRAEDLASGYDPHRPLVEAEYLEVERGNRIAVVGPNGAGKTTLVRTLIGELAPLAGAVRLGAGVTVGYLSQTHDTLSPETTALDALLSAAKGLTTERARSLLGSLLLTGDDVFKRISELSGGQRSRVALARLVVQSASLLVLDEPTNHLDIPSTEIMEDTLTRFDGTILFVSHDRFLIQAVATHIWLIDQARVCSVAGGWEDFLKWRGNRISQAARPAAAAEESQAPSADYRQSRRQANALNRLKRRHEELETQIEAAENDLKMLSEGISAAGQASNVPLVSDLGAKYQELSAHLDALWREWEELSEKLQ